MTDTPYHGPITGDDLWDVARQLYAAGRPGHEVCTDLGLAPATFWRRARQENWLRRDQPDIAPPPLDLDAPVQDPADVADKAWRRMCLALDAGRAGEALRWRRLHAELTFGEDRAVSRAQRATREQLDCLSSTARLIESQAKAALRLRQVEEEDE